MWWVYEAWQRVSGQDKISNAGRNKKAKGFKWGTKISYWYIVELSKEIGHGDKDVVKRNQMLRGGSKSYHRKR